MAIVITLDNREALYLIRAAERLIEIEDKSIGSTIKLSLLESAKQKIHNAMWTLNEENRCIAEYNPETHQVIIMVKPNKGTGLKNDVGFER